MSFVVLEFIRKFTLIAIHHVVDKAEACNPVAVLKFSVSLNVVLSSCKVPHKVSPIHEITLIGEEKLYVFHLGGYNDSVNFPAFYSTKP